MRKFSSANQLEEIPCRSLHQIESSSDHWIWLHSLGREVKVCLFLCSAGFLRRVQGVCGLAGNHSGATRAPAEHHARRFHSHTHNQWTVAVHHLQRQPQRDSRRRRLPPADQNNSHHADGRYVDFPFSICAPVAFYACSFLLLRRRTQRRSQWSSQIFTASSAERKFKWFCHKRPRSMAPLAITTWSWCPTTRKTHINTPTSFSQMRYLTFSISYWACSVCYIQFCFHFFHFIDKKYSKWNFEVQILF